MSVSEKHKNKEEVITARCKGRIKERLILISKVENVSMSEIVAKSIKEYYQRHYPDKEFFEKESQYFGRYGSGQGDLSVDRKKYVKGKLHGKHGHS
ncbi:MAG: hypothetical protein ABIA77_02120 [Candidatus Omnitrophota bacterium]